MTDLLLQPLADAFLEVGVYVAFMLAAFGWLHHRFGDRMMRVLAARWRSAPLVGALLGVIPGCGGAIVVMPLYLRGTVSFGTVVAALVATMGDASFVLLAVDLRTGLLVHGVLLVAGIVSGYAVDLLGIAPPRPRQPAGASLGAAEAIPPPRARTAAAPTPLGTLPATFWALWVLGFALAVPVSLQLTSGEALAARLSGIDPYLVLGATGTVCAALLYRRMGSGMAEAGGAVARDSLRSVLRAAGRETCFVTTWVAVAFVATAVVVEVGGIDMSTVASVGGIAGVVLGAAVGLIPGCAPQVLLTGLHATGVVPLPTLLANAASQDGDALFPLLLMDRRAALLGTVLSTLPGLVIGGTWLLAS